MCIRDSVGAEVSVRLSVIRRSEAGGDAEGEDPPAAGVHQDAIALDVGELLDRLVGDVDALHHEAQVGRRAVADLEIHVVGRADAGADIGVATGAGQVAITIGGRDARAERLRLEVQRRVGRPFRQVVQRDPLADTCLLYTSPSPRDRTRSRMPSSA